MASADGMVGTESPPRNTATAAKPAKCLTLLIADSFVADYFPPASAAVIMSIVAASAPFRG